MLATLSGAEVHKAAGWSIPSFEKLRLDIHQVPRKKRTLGRDLHPVAVGKGAWACRA